MEITRLSTKGQIVLPKAIRDAHAWESGTEFVLEDTADGVLLRPSAAFPESRLDEVAGCLAVRITRTKARPKPKSIAAMKQAVLREVSRRHDRGRY